MSDPKFIQISSGTGCWRFYGGAPTVGQGEWRKLVREGEWRSINGTLVPAAVLRAVNVELDRQ